MVDGGGCDEEIEIVLFVGLGMYAGMLLITGFELSKDIDLFPAEGEHVKMAFDKGNPLSEKLHALLRALETVKPV